jgi:hypothetical protein
MSASIETLPYELLLPILLDLSSIDIERLGQAVPQLTWIYHDWDFWATKAQHDFALPREMFMDSYHLEAAYPRHRYLQIQGYQQCLNDKLLSAINQNRAPWVKYFIDRGATNLNQSLEWVCGRSPQIGELILSHPLLDLNRVLEIAAAHGRLYLVKDLFNRGATSLYYARTNALLNNHHDVSDYLMTLVT